MNRRKRPKKHAALLIAIIISTILISAWSLLMRNDFYADYDTDLRKNPSLVLMMNGIREGDYPWKAFANPEQSFLSILASRAHIGKGSNTNPDGPADTNPDAVTFEPSSDTRVEATGNPSSEVISAPAKTDVSDDPAKTEVSSDPVKTDIADNPSGTDTSSAPAKTDPSGDSSKTDDSGTPAKTDSSGNPAKTDATSDNTSDDPEPTDTSSQAVAAEAVPLSFTTVDDDYFCDALFIGDSRMEGLADYCEPIYSRADFYVKRSMTIYQLLDGKELKIGKEKKSVWEVLDKKQYGKIYIQVGINEIGTGTPDYFANAYSKFINQVMEKQPNALIFITSIMHVTTSKSNSDGLYNNPNINSRNAVLIPLADNIRVFYIDINENLDDENGGMKQELSYDNVHLLGSSHEPFHQSLLTHGIIRDAQ